MSHERLWVRAAEPGRYVVANIPWFVEDIAAADLISAEERQGELFFTGLLESGGHSTIRVFVETEVTEVLEIRVALQNLGCSTELSHIDTLFSVDVPPEVELESVLTLLRTLRGDGLVEYEEGALRH